MPRVGGERRPPLHMKLSWIPILSIPFACESIRSYKNDCLVGMNSNRNLLHFSSRFHMIFLVIDVQGMSTFSLIYLYFLPGRVCNLNSPLWVRNLVPQGSHTANLSCHHLSPQSRTWNSQDNNMCIYVL